ncbi:putative ABC transport system permease protein [Catalinimonas alkaloidigena]|uniref:Putative ABC transport system permease protein n=1 Tax=Catalinimonas alkaloidigena TaxID=1075417 RepID=A0A1G9VK97_9BACT|nr:ABC transporter permease [Catalinimonas alkaloidigena]SDM72245.1 putative ABC transport system permease protein [Catalinimonas alkaloidigena]
MIRHYLTIAFRTLRRAPLFSFINLAGLAVGLAAALLLLSYLRYELSFDDFHANGNRIYRLRHDTYQQGAVENSSVITYYGAGPALQEQIPEVEAVVRLHRADGMLNYYTPSGEVISHHETAAFYADSAFFSVFSFPLLQGEAQTLLRHPQAVVISASAAQKYFGTEDPLGKTLSLTTQWAGGEYVVEGVFQAVPANSHVQFDFLFSIPRLLTNPQFRDGAWYWTNFYTYVLLKSGTDPARVEQKMATVLAPYLEDHPSPERFALQPLGDIHLHSHLPSELDVNPDARLVSLLGLLAFLLLSIAWLNYVNLSTAHATDRAREVGVRQVLGSSKRELIRRFLLESWLLTAGALGIAALLYVVATPFFSRLIALELPVGGVGRVGFWAGALGALLAGTLLAGLYPAFVLSGFPPLAALAGKVGKVRNSKHGISLRRVLVVLQFSAAIGLMLATFTLYRQLDFMRHQDLGMNLAQKVVIRGPRLTHGGSYLNAMEHFKQQVQRQTSVRSVTASSQVPGKPLFWTDEFRRLTDPEQVRKPLSILAVDEAFLPAYEIPLLAGRNFEKDRVSDLQEGVLLNEAALRYLELGSPDAAIGQQIRVGETGQRTVVGVVKDFHQQSLHQRSEPIAFYFIPWSQDYVTFTLQGNVRGTLATLKILYQASFPENAFDFFFLDAQFDRQYSAEERAWKLFLLFALLSLVIACLGLFGLASLLMRQRTKEVALRKVLGASAASLTVLLTRDFLQLIGLAFVLAGLVSGWLLHHWLQTFAYRVHLSAGSFMWAGALTLVVAGVTVGMQSLRTTRANPIEALRGQ